MKEKTFWIDCFRQVWREKAGLDDPAHDLSHLERVYENAEFILSHEGGDWQVVIPAIWFHDWVQVPKDHPDRAKASTLSAQAAIELLKKWDYPLEFLEAIAHAIESHSFSAGISPQTLEAKIVQDADRLDALGAIGVARLFSTTGKLSRPFYSPVDLWAEGGRNWDDRLYALDHFYVKILKISEQMNTRTAQKEAALRKKTVVLFLEELRRELEVSKTSKDC